MVDISNIGFQNNLKDNIIANIDKHVEIRYLKEIKKSRTYVTGLNDYFDKPDHFEKFIKKMQSKLATGLYVKEDDGKKHYGFNGDHRNSIKQILINELKIDEDKIKM